MVIKMQGIDNRIEGCMVVIGWLFACWFGIEFVQGGKWCYGVSRSR